MSPTLSRHPQGYARQHRHALYAPHPPCTTCPTPPQRDKIGIPMTCHTRIRAPCAASSSRRAPCAHTAQRAQHLGSPRRLAAVRCGAICWQTHTHTPHRLPRERRDRHLTAVASAPLATYALHSSDGRPHAARRACPPPRLEDPRPPRLEGLLALCPSPPPSPPALSPRRRRAHCQHALPSYRHRHSAAPAPPPSTPQPPARANGSLAPAAHEAAPTGIGSRDMPASRRGAIWRDESSACDATRCPATVASRPGLRE